MFIQQPHYVISDSNNMFVIVYANYKILFIFINIFHVSCEVLVHPVS